jgi:hypothetical protein
VAVEHHDPKTKLSLDEDEDDEIEPLSGAAREEALKVVRLLIARGADVNAGDANGRRPIHQAVAAGLQDMAELLLRAGADPSLGCKAIGVANSTLHQAVIGGDAQMTRLLLRAAPHLDPDVRGKNGMTPLCLAARSNQVRSAPGRSSTAAPTRGPSTRPARARSTSRAPTSERRSSSSLARNAKARATPSRPSTECLLTACDDAGRWGRAGLCLCTTTRSERRHPLPLPR